MSKQVNAANNMFHIELKCKPFNKAKVGFKKNNHLRKVIDLKWFKTESAVGVDVQ